MQKRYVKSRHRNARTRYCSGRSSLVLERKKVYTTGYPNVYTKKVFFTTISQTEL